MISNWLLLLFLEYSLQFIHVLKYAASDSEVKTVLGGHIMALHQRCIAIKLAFAREAHAIGEYQYYYQDERVSCLLFSCLFPYLLLQFQPIPVQQGNGFLIQIFNASFRVK